MIAKMPDWTLNLKTNIKSWLDDLMVAGQPFGRFRLAKEGCIYLPYDIISVHFAAELYERLGIVETLTSEQKREWMNLSLSWRNLETGEVTDPDGIEKGVPDNDDLVCSVQALRRNLNRCCVGVFGAGSNKMTLQHDVKAFSDIEKMRTAFDAEAWESDSWGAGAHCAHYISAMLQWQKAGYTKFDRPIEEAVKYLYSRQHSDTGAFCGKDHTVASAIGGILKIYVRLFGEMNLKIQYPERIIDTSIDLLRSGKLVGVCEAHNALIVLLMCRNFTNYRLSDIKKEALLSIDRDFLPRLMSDGAFCSEPGVFEKKIWGVRMFETNGVEQSDIHGTMLMVQAVRVAAELLDLEQELGFAPSGWKRTVL